MKDSSKLLSRKSPQYADREKFLATLHAAAHRFNSEKRGSREAANYLVKQFDLVACTLLKAVKDHSSAVASQRPGRSPAEEERARIIRQLEAKVASLEGELGRRSVEASFFRSALRKVEALRRQNEESGAMPSTRKPNSNPP